MGSNPQKKERLSVNTINKSLINVNDEGYRQRYIGIAMQTVKKPTQMNHPVTNVITRQLLSFSMHLSPYYSFCRSQEVTKGGARKIPCIFRHIECNASMI